MKVWNEKGELLVIGGDANITVNPAEVEETEESKMNIEADDGWNYTVCVKLSAGKPALYLMAAGTSRIVDGTRQIRCDDDGLYYPIRVKYSAGKPALYLETPGLP